MAKVLVVVVTALNNVIKVGPTDGGGFRLLRYTSCKIEIFLDSRHVIPEIKNRNSLLFVLIAVDESFAFSIQLIKILL